MRFKPIIVLLLLLCTVHVLTAQSLPRRIDGFRVSVVKYTDTDSLVHIGFNGAVFTAESGMLPVYLERLDWDPSWQNPEVRLSNMIFDVLDNADERMIPDLAGAGQEITVRSVVTYEKKTFPDLLIHSCQKKSWLGIYEKLTSFRLKSFPALHPLPSGRQAAGRTALPPFWPPGTGTNLQSKKPGSIRSPTASLPKWALHLPPSIREISGSLDTEEE